MDEFNVEISIEKYAKGKRDSKRHVNVHKNKQRGKTSIRMWKSQSDTFDAKIRPALNRTSTRTLFQRDVACRGVGLSMRTKGMINYSIVYDEVYSYKSGDRWRLRRYPNGFSVDPRGGPSTGTTSRRLRGSKAWRFGIPGFRYTHEKRVKVERFRRYFRHSNVQSYLARQWSASAHLTQGHDRLHVSLYHGHNHVICILAQLARQKNICERNFLGDVSQYLYTTAVIRLSKPIGIFKYRIQSPTEHARVIWKWVKRFGSCVNMISNLRPNRRRTGYSSFSANHISVGLYSCKFRSMMIERIIAETGLDVMPVGDFLVERHLEYALPFNVCPKRILSEEQASWLLHQYRADVPRSDDDPRFIKPHAKLYAVIRW